MDEKNWFEKKLGMRKIGMKKEWDIKNWDEKNFRWQFRKSKVDKGGKMNKNWQVFSTSLHLSEETWAMIVCQK